MTGIYALAALWLGLALVATLLSIWLRVATALSEIVVGTIAQLIIGALVGSAVLGADETWIKFLSGTGAIVLTFLAGAELDPVVFRRQWKEATAIGGQFFRAVFRLRGCRPVAPGLGCRRKLACRHRDVDHIRCRRVCGNARIRIERD